MDSSELESRLKSLPLRQPSAEFGKPETLADAVRHSSQSQGLLERIRNMPWQTKSIGGIGIAASLLVAYVLIASMLGTKAAFADVISKLNQAKSLTFDSQVTLNDGKVTHRSRNYYLVPGKHRSESLSENEVGAYVIIDSEAGKMMMVDALNKTVRVSSFKGAAGRDISAETIEGIRSLQAGDSKAVGEKQIDGKKAKGFEFARDNETVTVWTSAESGELVQIHIVSTNVPSGPATTVWSNIKLDAQLKPDLFSLKPPEGFKVTPFQDVDLNLSPANFVAASLKMYAKHNDNEFPEDLQKGLSSLLQQLAPKPGEKISEDATQFAFHGAASLAVLRTGKRDEQWKYFPGATAGDKEKIVFWFYDKRKNQYSAVFGDFQVKVVAKDDLPRGE